MYVTDKRIKSEKKKTFKSCKRGLNTQKKKEEIKDFEKTYSMTKKKKNQQKPSPSVVNILSVCRFRCVRDYRAGNWSSSSVHNKKLVRLESVSIIQQSVLLEANPAKGFQVKRIALCRSTNLEMFFQLSW
jgi:NAD(P)H-nitrite reductase large subunit